MADEHGPAPEANRPQPPAEPSGLDAVLGTDYQTARRLADYIVDTVRDPLLVLDAGLRVVAAGREFYRTFAVTPTDTVGRRVYELGNGQWNIPALRTLLEEVLPRETVFRDFEVEYRFERIGRRVMLLNARRLRTTPGGPPLILLALEDVTDRRAAEEARRDLETRFTEMVRNVRDHSIFLTDPDGVITSWNVSAERVIGYTESEAVGRHFALIFTPEDVAAGVPGWELRQAAAEGRAEDERWHRRKDGSLFWALGIVTPLRAAGGRLTGFSKILRDMTDRKRAEDARRASEERLRMALEAARMGVWTWDPAADVHTRGETLNRLLGLEPVETAGPLADFLGRVHPADREAVRAGFDAALREGRPLAVEFRVAWPDGSVRWLRDQGGWVGTPGAGVLSGAVVDVTDRREAVEAVRASEERLRLVVESATDYAIFTLAPDRAVTSWSPGAEIIFGYTAAEIVGRSGDDLFTPEDRAAGAPAKEASDADRVSRAINERWHLRKDGSRFFGDGVMTPLGDPSRGFVKVLRDLTDRKRLADALHRARAELEEKVKERTAELEAALESLEAEMNRRRDLARRLSRASEEERRRVSRDLHDSVGQLLTGLALEVKAAATADLPPATAAKLAEVQRTADELGRQVHGLAVRLRPTVLDDVGLEAALGQLVSEWSARTKVPVDFQVTGLEGGRLPAEAETVLYRVVQEALTNVAKHAKAKAVSVVVGRHDGIATAAVEDDGVGFDPETAGRGRLGLFGMRERVELAGGQLDIESSPGAGTTVIARIPISAGDGGGGKA